MARDMERRKAYNEEWKKINTVKYQLRVGRSSGIPDAVEKLAKNQGKTETAILRDALVEKLQREGYLPGEKEESQP